MNAAVLEGFLPDLLQYLTQVISTGTRRELARISYAIIGIVSVGGPGWLAWGRAADVAKLNNCLAFLSPDETTRRLEKRLACT